MEVTTQASRQYRPGAAHPVYWKKKIEQLLLTPTGPVANGPWDPYTQFRKQRHVNRFFSGHQIRYDHQEDREAYARWAIDKVLENYSPDNYLVSGELLGSKIQSQSSSYHGRVPKKILDAIQAECRKDVDFEAPNAISNEDNEAMETISAAAQAILTASPNCLGPPINPCVLYLRMFKSGEYGRKKLTLWKSRLFGAPEFSKGFLDIQVTAIGWMLTRFLGSLPRLNVEETGEERRARKSLRGPKYFGGILADSMGLGKTLSTIAVIALMAKQSLNVTYDAKGRKCYAPILILTPNPQVTRQWIDEITQSTSSDTIVRILVTGGDEKNYDITDPRVFFISSQHFSSKWPGFSAYVWNTADPNAAKTILIVSIDTWAGRTCKVENQGEEAVWSSQMTRAGRRFSIVVVDEAYKVKNPITNKWRSVALLKRQWTLLITATPCMNTLSDLMGPARLLWDRAKEYLQEERPHTWDALQKSVRCLEDLKKLDHRDPWDDWRLVAGRPALLAKLLCKDKTTGFQDLELTKRYLHHFESLAILKRGPSSTLFEDQDRVHSISMDGIFPAVENYTVDIKHEDSQVAGYQRVLVDLSIQYLQALKRWGANRGKNGEQQQDEPNNKSTLTVASIHRRFRIASASLAILRLEKLFNANDFGTRIQHVKLMRQNGTTLIEIMEFLLEPDDQEPETALNYLHYAVRGSPILRHILKHKILILEETPILAYYYELVLQFLGVNCRVLHAGLSSEERKALIANFNSSQFDTCSVLIQMYSVGFAGTNLHKACSRVLIASQAHSLAVQSQATHRVIRVGQTRDVKVYRLRVENSYHELRESRQVEKFLPELASRIQGKLMASLVIVLNIFQYEVDEAWDSDEGKMLRKTRNLTIDLIESHATMVESKKKAVITIPDDQSGPSDLLSALGKRKRDGANLYVQQTEELIESRNAPPVVKKMRLDSVQKEETEAGSLGWFPGHFVHENDEDLTSEFLAIRKRGDYYKEFKVLPASAKSSFSHEKNMLRRMLSYGKGRVWTVDDLNDPAILERALELMLRTQLGSRRIDMRPLPLFDHSRVSVLKRMKLQSLLSNVEHTDKDVEKANGEENSSGKGDLKDTLKGISLKQPLDKIDEALEREKFKTGASKAQKSLNRKGVSYSKTDEDDGSGFKAKRTIGNGDVIDSETEDNGDEVQEDEQDEEDEDMKLQDKAMLLSDDERESIKMPSSSTGVSSRRPPIIEKGPWGGWNSASTSQSRPTMIKTEPETEPPRTAAARGFLSALEKRQSEKDTQ